MKDSEKLRKSHNLEEIKERHGNSIQCELLDHKKKYIRKETDEIQVNSKVWL